MLLFCGWSDSGPLGRSASGLLQQDFSMYVLYGLMFLVGISIGSDRKAWAALKGQQLRIVLVPLATIVGTLAGSIGVSFLLTDIRLTDCLAIGSGFGYYSLSSIFITEYRGAESLQPQKKQQ